MGQQKQRNRRWVLASRPHGAPVPENFRLEEDDVATPGEGQVLLRTVYLSLDPYMRGRMSDEPSYSPPVDIGGVMVGGTVSRVVESNHPDYQPGDWVLGYSGWQDYDISSGDDLDGLFFRQLGNGISQLNTSPCTRLRAFKFRPNIGRKHIATNGHDV